MIVDFGPFGVEIPSDANRMLVEAPVSRVKLETVSPVAAEYP